ncbi:MULTISPECIES: DNA topoisomerase IB [unclassified Devosia]|uniref:DNA topoisomerase IB n=1 Tax=unclassified Devosia TaxID=196773 RepID=UPI001AC7EF99|nr:MULTISPECIES: DNA topoisomerase IB [unclassified Devosia]MBN9303623.1 DNA topoisomerase IB [Devosia sp.]
MKTVSRDALTVRRVRRGAGYAYTDAEGKTWPRGELRDRALHLGIPPAWTEVRIAPEPLMHIQACGVDAAGRVQYIYHSDWELRRQRKKQRQLAMLTGALPRIRRRVAADLEAEAGSRTLALAIGVALIDRTAMRIGRERYLDARGTRGAGTLFGRDVAVRGDDVILRFPAKSGKLADYTLSDARLAAAIGRIKTIPGKRLLMYRDDEGATRALRSDEINRYLREISGVRVTAKDFRTLHASALAAEALAKLEPGPSVSARRRQVAGVAKTVAAFLRNTPAITRQSYIAPCLFAMFEKARLAELWAAAAERHDGLRVREARLAAVLEAAG